jgi:hypothetical protein
MDGFKERELNPPPAPPNYDVTPPNSRPGTATPHFASTKLRPKPGDGHIITVGCVPAGVMDAKPADPATKMAARARATAAVAARMRDALAAEDADPEGAGDASWRAWRTNKTLREPNVFETLKKKQQAVDATRKAAMRTRKRTTGRVADADANRASRAGARVTSSGSSSAPVGALRPDSTAAPRTAASSRSARADIDIVGARTGEPGEQSTPMILNLDHLEDSSLEVLLHELRKAEEAIGAGERSPEAIENAAKLARAAEWKSPNAGTVSGGAAAAAAAARERAVRDAVSNLAGDEEPDGMFFTTS